MNVLLDTHVLIWSYILPEKLGKKTLNVLRSSTTKIHVSPVTAGEIACLVKFSRLNINQPVKVWADSAVKSIASTWIELSANEVIHAWTLPGHFHKDPADRLLTAQSIERGFILITADERILAYRHVQTINAVQ